MKTILILFSLAFFGIMDLTAQINLTDTLKIDTRKDSTSFYISSDSTVIDLSPLSDSENDTYDMDSVFVDSLSLERQDSIISKQDSVILEADSLILEADSILIPDSIIKSDTIVRTDSVALDKKIDPKATQPKYIDPQSLASVKALNYIYYTYRRYLNYADDRWDDYYFSFDNVDTNPAYYKFIVPITYYSSAFDQATTIEGWKPSDIVSDFYDKRQSYLEKGLPDLREFEQIDHVVNKHLLKLYTSNLRLVTRNEKDYMDLNVLSSEELKAEKHKENIIEFVQNNAGISRVSESELVVFKPNFWSYGGNGYLQFSQNYISDNWYKGGESTKSLLSGFTWQANYNDKQKTQFENKLEWKLGFITAPSDTVHTYKANNDLFRFTSKLGYRAIQNWYYTLSAEFQTQLFSSYETNSDNLVSALLSPATLNVGVGMDYKYTKDGIINLSVLVNPLNYTLYSVLSDKVDPTKFSIKEGHKHESIIGSRLDATMTWKVFTSLMWESKLSYNTNYEMAIASWENTFTFIVNKYLSTKLFVHGRFDDSVSKNPDDSYFQLQELFSFGLNYTW